MPSPTTPSEFEEAIPSNNADFCTRFTKFLGVPELLASVFGWMFNSDGSVSSAFKEEVATLSTPTGMIAYFLTQNVGDGWLLCDGREVSRTTYAALYNEIGTRYGDGDTLTTFNLPDARGRSLLGAGTGTGLTARDINAISVGEENHTLTAAEMPAHTHGTPTVVATADATGSGQRLSSATAVDGVRVTSSAGGGTSHNTIHPCLIGWVYVKT